MNETTSHLVQNLSALVGLLAVTIVFAAMHDSPHAGEALAAFVGYAAGSRSTHPVLAAVAPIVAAGAVALVMSGCASSQALPAVEMGCDVVRKVCQLANGVCLAVPAP